MTDEERGIRTALLPQDIDAAEAGVNDCNDDLADFAASSVSSR
ncbi:hypothetical protein [Ornithinicoccus halotolerans]|nr:hypothetical protein [Ornithinicoccus halotolerans]